MQRAPPGDPFPVENELGECGLRVEFDLGKSETQFTRSSSPGSESVITRKSAEDLALKKGDEVTVVIKSTEVMLQKS